MDDSASPMIELRDVWKSFGDTRVLRGASLKVARGSTCVLFGVSGSGKTVLLKHVIGLVRPDRGAVIVDGRELSTLDEDGLRALRLELGILFQAGALFDSMTVAENIALPLKEQLHLGARERRRRIDQMLELLDLEDARDLYPGELSGGMRKRVAFARAVATYPKILLFDEPTAGLDPLTTESVTEEILLVKRTMGITTLAITHDPASGFTIADTVALLHEGRLIEHLPKDEFRRSRHPAVVAFLHSWLEREAAARAT